MSVLPVCCRNYIYLRNTCHFNTFYFCKNMFWGWLTIMDIIVVITIVSGSVILKLVSFLRTAQMRITGPSLSKPAQYT